MGHHPWRNVNWQPASLWGCKPSEIQLPNFPAIPLFWSQPWPRAQSCRSLRFVRGGKRRERGRFCWDLACGGTERRVSGRSDIKGGAANRLVKRPRNQGQGSTPGASLEGELGPGAAAAVWEERAAAPGGGCAGSRSCVPAGARLLACAGARSCQPAPLPFFIRFLLLPQRSGRRCPAPPRASGGLSAGLSSQVALGKLVRMPRRAVPSLGPRGVDSGCNAGG